MATALSTTLVEVRRALTDLAETPLWSLSNDELAADIAEVSALRAQTAELELRLVAQADRNNVAADHGAATTHAFWAETTRQTRPEAKRRLTLAAALDTNRHVTREAVTRGHLGEDQAVAIVRAIDALPAELEPDVVLLAEKELVAHAACFDATALAALGKRILEVVAPEVADQQELKALEQEEARAAEAVRFTIADDGHGQCHGRFTLPTVQGAMLRKLVMANWRPVSTGSTTTISGPRVMGEAFMRLVERYPADAIPDHGGVAATIVVSMTLEQLQTDGVATLDTGQRITAGEARRLACEAGIIPLVLGKKSAVLDIGYQDRLFTKPQRVAIAQRDRSCTADGCDYPPGLCHVHHDTPWADGGRTSVDNGRLLCPRHHRMLHSPHFRTSPSKHGRIVYRRV